MCCDLRRPSIPECAVFGKVDCGERSACFFSLPPRSDRREAPPYNCDTSRSCLNITSEQQISTQRAEARNSALVASPGGLHVAGANGRVYVGARQRRLFVHSQTTQRGAASPKGAGGGVTLQVLLSLARSKLRPGVDALSPQNRKDRLGRKYLASWKKRPLALRKI